MKINQPLKTSQVVVVAGVIVLVAAGIVAYFQTAKEEPVPVVQNIQNPVVGAQTLPAGENATSRIESSQSQAPIQNEAVDTSSWQTYRNDEYGFEVKYPDFPIQTKFPESEGYVFPCGKQLGDSFRIGSSEHFGPTIYDFTVYSNPQKMAAKDFFLCKINATSNGIFSESEINKIDSITVGEQKTAAFQIAWDNTIKTVLIANGGNMIEIQYDAGQAPDEFSQMLSTFKLIGANAEIGNALVTERVVDSAKFGAETVYIKETTRTDKLNNLQKYYFQLILRDGSSEKIIDSSYGGDNSGDVHKSGISFSKVIFSPSGNYLIVKNGQWESSYDSVYDLASGKIIYKDLSMAEITNFTPDERYFYSCGSSEMGAVNMAKVISTQGTQEKYKYGGPYANESEGAFYENVSCGYDVAREVIYFNFKNSLDVVMAKDKTIEFSIATGMVSIK